jgi:3-oxoacyl-(acyl-carrier-protein) synthase
MSKRVFITGMGIISALGSNAAENRDCLRHGQTGIKKAKILETRYTEIFPFGEVPYSTLELKERAGIANEKGISRTEVLALLAIQQTIKDAALSNEEIATYDMAFLSASTVGGMSLTDQLHQDANKIGEPSDYLASYNIGEHANSLVKRFGIKGVSTTFNTACSSSANAIMFGAKLIKSGRCKRAIVGGTDALAKYTVNGFNSLQILSPEHCKPFDKNRTGLTLGEGAAYLVLESEEVVRDKKIYGELTGYGNANDAFHPSSISDDAIGIIASISEALEVAKLDPDAIDYINAHGTGTMNNDITEQTGMNKIFNTIPPFQSTKTYTGHTLAAAGAIEAVFSLLAMGNNELYPSLNCNDPIDDFKVVPISNYTDNYKIKHVLSNSFGFGGNCSSLIFSKV